MKKLLFLSLALMLCLTACGKKPAEEVVEPTEPVEQEVVEEPTEPVEEPEDDAAVENQTVSYETLDALKEAVGFDFEAAEALEGAEKKLFASYMMGESTVAEIDYVDAEDNAFAYVRKARLADLEEGQSITGLEETDSEEKKFTTEEVDGFTVSSIEDKAYVAEWSDEEFAYCAVFTDGVPQSTLLDFAKLVK